MSEPPKKHLNGNSTHGAASNHVEEIPEEEREPAPDAVSELAASCARFVRAKYHVPLDGTSDTLSLLDQYIRDARAEIAMKPETTDLLVASIGAYFGEVIRRAYGGNWFAIGDYDAWRLDMASVFLTFNPLGMAREALFLEEADGWHAHLEMDDAYKDDVNRRLEALDPGGVDEEEYFAPTTRFDVISLAIEALRAKMVEDGHGDVRFSSDDYRKK